MFCNEEIINAYLGQPNHDDDGELFLDYYHDMVLHLTDSLRIVLETPNYYISIETGGIFKINKTGPIQTIARDDEWLDSYCHIDEDEPDDEPWTEYEYTLFVGEKIISVSKKGKSYSVEFTDFTLDVIPYSSSNDVPWYYPAPYSRVLGTEHLIRKCSCGGTGVLDIDFVSDYGVRCDTCHKGTSANQCACDAIEEWNCVDDLPIIGEYPQERFEKCRGKAIDYIVISDTHSTQMSFPFICDSIIVAIEGKKFAIRSSYCGHGRFGFSVEEYIDYNPAMWPHKIEAQRNPIRMTGEFDEGKRREMTFDVEGKALRIISDNGHLTVECADNLRENIKQ